MENFIIGSGRCGSTLLTSMLSKKPKAMMLSELMQGYERRVLFDRQAVSGRFFSTFIGGSCTPIDIILKRDRPSEVLSSDETATELPVLMISTLPMISEEPEQLFEDILEITAGFPEQPIKAHFAMLFQWMLQRLDKTVWIERSGASIEYLPELMDMYPDAKYVHIHRDGLESALSMLNFSYFKIVVSFFFDPPTREEILKTEYGGQPVSAQDPFTQRMTGKRLPAEKFGEYWSYQQLRGARGLARMKPGQCMHVKFEDLVSRPRETVSAVADFFGLDTDGGQWVDEAVALVKGVPTLRAKDLPSDEYASLAKACEAGQILLGRENVDWVEPTFQLIREVSEAN